MSHEKVLNALQELANLLHTERTLGAVLAHIAEAATVAIPGCDAASVTISLEGRHATAAITARVALELDMVQYDTSDGPCLKAFDRASTVRIDVLDDSEMFPHVASAATARGIRSVLSVPATWRREVIATLNLYSRTGGGFDQAAESVAAVLAAQVAIAVSRSPEFLAARTTTDLAQREVDHQSTIAGATGLLMANEDCTREQAEGLLRSAAVSSERTILEIAERIVQHHRRAVADETQRSE